MPFTNSERDQFPSIVPTDPTSPTVPAHLQGIVDAIEPRTNMRVADWSEANTFLTPFEDGMIVYVADVGDATAGLFLRSGDAWEKLWPTTYSGTGDPDDALGADGDVYFRVS